MATVLKGTLNAQDGTTFSVLTGAISEKDGGSLPAADAS